MVGLSAPSPYPFPLRESGQGEEDADHVVDWISNNDR